MTFDAGRWCGQVTARELRGKGPDMTRRSPPRNARQSGRSVARMLPGALAVMAQSVVGLSAMAEPYVTPAGCTGLVTAAYKSCKLSHILECALDPPGSRRKFTVKPGNVLDAEVYIDPDGFVLWQKTPGADRGWSVGEVRDPESLRELITTGSDRYDYFYVVSDGRVFREVGERRLTGADVIVDGLRFDAIRFELHRYDGGGKVYFVETGEGYFDPNWKYLFVSRSTKTFPPGPPKTSRSEITEFRLPGEPGFLTEIATEHCELNLSMLSTPDMTGVLP